MTELRFAVSFQCNRRVHYRVVYYLVRLTPYLITAIDMTERDQLCAERKHVFDFNYQAC